ncbi:hypothetical protein Pla163_22560 [Planctomycetes bacterium Pla163]|uniref:Aerotolerance regulator N-terminal domain-containing protein n=1 Tax=Rohdeia mirabilis TaxID=2528008 RepID=A0A518D0Z8_9BACT|nr:hypothetical protein Pla163_22560 [Planctomycetes bacterium Pla163]
MEFAAPTLLVLLVVPGIVLALAFAPRRPVRALTGTLALWRRAARGEALSGSRRRFGPPLWLLVAVVGLVAWAVALADPRGPAHEREEWLVLVDRRPRMLLAHESGETRLFVALEAARARLFEERGDVRVRWRSPGLEDLVTRASDPAPSARYAAAPAAARPPDFEAHDGPGVLWLSCDAPERAGASDAESTSTGAGFVASGGAEVPGFVAAGAVTWTFWESGAFSEREAPTGTGTVVIGADVPELVADFARVFARTRGLEPVAAAPAGAESNAAVRLVVERAPGGAPLVDGVALVDPDGRRIGLLDDGRALGVDAGAVGIVAVRAVEPASGRTEPVTALADGHLRVAPGVWRAPDPEALALGLGALLDRALAPDPRLVPVAGRRDQGPTRAQLGASPEPLPTRFELRAPLALVAAAAFALAAVLRRR